MEWGGGELANQHPVQKILRKILRKWWRGQIYLRKALIGGNIAFGMGWWGAGQSASSAENLAENLAENGLGKGMWEGDVGGDVGRGVLKTVI